MISIYLGLDLDLKFVSESWLMSMLWNGWDNSHLIKIWYFSKYSNISLTLWHRTWETWPGDTHLTSPQGSKPWYLYLLLNIQYLLSMLDIVSQALYHCVCAMRRRGQQASKPEPVSVWLAPNTRDNISNDRLELLRAGNESVRLLQQTSTERGEERRDLTGVLV